MSARAGQSEPHPDPSTEDATRQPTGYMLRPRTEDIEAWTDRYFTKTKETIARFGDTSVTYAVFMRRPVIFTPRLAVSWLQSVAKDRGIEFQIDLNYDEGEWVGAGEPLIYITGSFYHLVDLETLYLQKLGAACVAAYNAFTMCMDLPDVAFLAFDARHCAGVEMEEMMAYAASVGSRAAQQQGNAKGFIGNSNDATAHYYGRERGLGTMPHALIGYAGSTLRAAEMFHEVHPDDDLIVLVDYYGREVTDTLTVCRHFPELAAAGRLGFASILTAAVSSKASTRKPPTRYWNGTRRSPSAAIAMIPSFVISPGRVFQQRPSITCARSSTTPVSIGLKSSPPPASMWRSAA